MSATPIRRKCSLALGTLTLFGGAELRLGKLSRVPASIASHTVSAKASRLLVVPLPGVSLSLCGGGGGGGVGGGGGWGGGGGGGAR